MGPTKNYKEAFEKSKSIVNFVLTIILMVFLVVIPPIFGFMKMPTEMGISILPIAVALFFLNLDKFKRFKGAGIEAQMQDAVNKTYAALEQLKDLAIVLAEPIVDTLAVSGKQFQYIHLKYKLENVAKISDALRKLGASETEINKACEIIYKRIISDHVRVILNFLKKENADKGDLFSEDEQWDLVEWNNVKIEKFVKDHALVLNNDAIEWIKDLEYFLANKKLRREDNWQS